MSTRSNLPLIDRMGECALLVRLGRGISHRTNSRVHALSEALRREQVHGIVDIVPAYSSVLVTFDPEELPDSELTGQIGALGTEAVESHRHSSRTHTVPVQYGGEAGPDLEELANLHGLTVDEVVRLHSERLYTVYFLGFLPGFAYMGRVPRQIATARLGTPRVRVPSGSVGIAGMQTGVYPLASPGGWRIIGRTNSRIWDPSSSDPALFAPGDRVRFVASDLDIEAAAAPAQSVAGQNPVFRVEQPGGLTLVQDFGRPGYAHTGLSQGGAFDREAVSRANALLGNAPGAAVLEIAWGGLALRAIKNVTIALEGADLGCRVDGFAVSPGITWFVRAGAVVKFGSAPAGRGGLRSYLAVSGGIDVPPVLGSGSTHLTATMGGYAGRPLRVGDLLGAGASPASQAHLAGRLWVGRPDLELHSPTVLRFTRFVSSEGLSSQAIRDLVGAEWEVGEQSDRMGLRLRSASGAPPLPVPSGELVSFGVVRGAIQLPPDGNPVVLGPDHQTTGGYPLVGVVAQADWPLLGQLRPGDKVRFQEVTIGEARSALAESRRALQRGLDVLRAMG